MPECEIAPGALFEAAEDATAVFRLAEEALDLRALFVEVPVGLACPGARRVRWNHGHGTLLPDPVEDGVAVIGAIGEHRLDRDHRDGVEQGDGFGRVTGLTRREREAERIAETVGEAVQLAGPAAS